LSSQYGHPDLAGPPIDPRLADWHPHGPHFPSVSDQIVLNDMGQSGYGENEQIGTASQIGDGIGDLFSDCLFPMGSGDSQSDQPLATNPGFSNSQTPNQPHATMYVPADDFIVLGQDDEVVDSSSDFLDAGLDSGYLTLNPPANIEPSRSDSGNSSEWSHLMLESDSNGRETSQPRTTEILPIPQGDSALTANASGSTRKRRVRGQFRTLELREKTSLTRKMGACLRCKMQRVRVSFHRATFLSNFVC
jgi:hypothetical protein